MKRFSWIIVATLLVSCGAKNKTLNTKEDEEMQTEIDSTTTDLLGDLNAGFGDPIEEVDSLFAYIERSVCFGRCPSYVLKVYDSGYATYHGKDNVDMIGHYVAWADADILTAVKELANDAGYWDMGEEYDDKGVTDIPSTYTALDYDGFHKEIKNRYGGPQELYDFEDALDALFKELDWTETEVADR